MQEQLGNAFYLDGCSIGENFGYALHYFGGVIAHAHNSIRSVLAGVLQQKFEGIFARLLAEVR